MHRYLLATFALACLVVSVAHPSATDAMPADGTTATSTDPNRADGLSDDPWPAIDACMLADMAGNSRDPADDTPGAAIAIARDDQRAGFKAYGVKHADDGGEVGPETMFRIGSTTKTHTAAAVMQLREEDLVDLHEPISTYLEDFALAELCHPDCIALHHLMTHSSGIPPTYRVADPRTPLLDWVGSLGDEPLLAPPGSFWNYANQSFSLAGAVVETVSGQPFPDYLQDRVFEPSGMQTTTASAVDVIEHGDYATGHNGDRRIAPGDRYYPMSVPASGVWSTPGDMVTWALQLSTDGGGVIDPDSASLMQEPHIDLGTLPWAHYGYGVFVTDYQDTADPDQHVTVYDHSGSTTGFSSQLYWVPERGVAVSILANTSRALSRAARCVLLELASVEPQPSAGHETGPAEWQDLVGTYSMLDVALWPFTANITLEGDELTMEYLDVTGNTLALGAEHVLRNSYLDTFVADVQPFLRTSRLDLTFVRDAEDESTVRFARNRNMVGERVGDVPARVTIVGETCQDVTLTAGRDLEDMSVVTSGVNVPVQMRDLPIKQDDPSDPSTASNKADIQATSELSLFSATLRGRPGDSLRFYLMYDKDDDGDFVFPDDKVAEGIGGPHHQLMYAERLMPPGHYQIWVHGRSVPAGTSTFDVDVIAIHGDALSIENDPSVIREGETWTLQVCADDIDPDIAEPSLGAIVYQYSSPPRLFRTMVDWRPEGEMPTPTPDPTPSAAPPSPPIFLPTGLRGATGRQPAPGAFVACRPQPVAASPVWGIMCLDRCPGLLPFIV